jgi:hypothetical protein
VLKKKGRGACDAGPVEANLEDRKHYSALASKLQLGIDARSSVSLSPMESAFLAGLVDLAQRGDASIAPADDVDPSELRRAIHALVLARGGARP